MRYVGTALDVATAMLLLLALYLLAPSVQTWLVQYKSERARREALHELPRDNAQRIGDVDGELVAVVYSDYQCRFCRMLDDSLAVVLANSEGKYIALKHYPLGGRPQSIAAAEAAECAASFGSFEGMHRLLFESTEWSAPDSTESLLMRGIVTDARGYRRCLESDDRLKTVQTHTAEMEQLGIASTPAILIGDSVITGAQSVETLRTWVERPATRN